MTSGTTDGLALEDISPWARPATALERSGKGVVRRAAVAAAAGGALITIMSASFGPRFFAADVRVWGIGLGVLVLLLMLGPILSGKAPSWAGPLLLAAAIAAVPLAAGGLFVGSLLLLGAGVVMASVAPAPPASVMAMVPARAFRRLASFLVDGFAAIGGTVVIALASPLSEREGWLVAENGVYLVWATVWLVVTVPITVLLNATIGEWLLGVRQTREPGRRPSPIRTVLRQVLRGLVGLGLPQALILITLNTLIDGDTGELTLGPGNLAVVALTFLGVVAVAVLSLVPRRTWLDVVIGTIPRFQQLRAPAGWKPRDEDDLDDAVTAVPADARDTAPYPTTQRAGARDSHG